MLNIDFVKYIIYLVCEEIFIYYKCTVYISCCIEAASAAFDAASKVPSTGEEAVSFEELPEAEKLKPLENPESELRPEIDGISLVVFPLHRMSSPNVVTECRHRMSSPTLRAYISGKFGHFFILCL